MFFISWLGAFGLIILINNIVNLYRDYGTTFFRPLVQTARKDKVGLLSQFENKPEAVVIGSSRVMRMEPDYLDSIFVYDFFNLGVKFAIRSWKNRTFLLGRTMDRLKIGQSFRNHYHF